MNDWPDYELDRTPWRRLTDIVTKASDWRVIVAAVLAVAAGTAAYIAFAWRPARAPDRGGVAARLPGKRAPAVAR